MLKSIPPNDTRLLTRNYQEIADEFKKWNLSEEQTEAFLKAAVTSLKGSSPRVINEALSPFSDFHKGVPLIRVLSEIPPDPDPYIDSIAGF